MYFQLKKLNDAIRFNDGHICKDIAKEFHVFFMETEDSNVEHFRGELEFDVTIVRPGHNNQGGESEKMPTTSTLIDISEKPAGTDGTSEQVEFFSPVIERIRKSGNYQGKG